MRKYLLYILTVYLALTSPNIVKALVCDNQTLADYRDIASNVRIDTSYKMKDGKPVFDIIISNLNYDMYVSDGTKKTSKNYYYEDFTSPNQLILSGYAPNQTRLIKIYADIPGCRGFVLSTRYVNLPAYNERYTDPLCEGAEDYSLCQKWTSNSVSDEVFEQRVTAYKNRDKTEPEVVIEEQKETFRDKLLRFIGNYYVYLVSGVVILILLLSALKNVSIKKHQFNFKV